MKTINEVIELMREGDYGIGVTNEEEAKKTIDILVDNGFEENEYLKGNLPKALKRITTGDLQSSVVELFVDCTGRITYVYTGKESYNSDGEREVGDGILFTSIAFSEVKPKELLRNFDIVGFKDVDLIEGIYYNGFLYTPYISMNRFDLDLVEKVVSCPSTINKIVREDKTIWQREINIEDLELSTEVEVKVKGMNDPIHGVIISSDSELMILFDNYTTSKSLIEGDYEIIKIL